MWEKNEVVRVERVNIRELLAPGPDSLRLRLGLDIRNTGDAIGGGCQQQYEKSGVSTH